MIRIPRCPTLESSGSSKPARVPWQAPRGRAPKKDRCASNSRCWQLSAMVTDPDLVLHVRGRGGILRVRRHVCVRCRHQRWFSQMAIPHQRPGTLPAALLLSYCYISSPGAANCAIVSPSHWRRTTACSSYPSHCCRLFTSAVATMHTQHRSALICVEYRFHRLRLYAKRPTTCTWGRGTVICTRWVHSGRCCC